MGTTTFDLTAPGSAATRHALLTDHLGSVVGLVAESGTLLERWSYDAWGEARDPDTGVLLASSPPATPTSATP